MRSIGVGTIGSTAVIGTTKADSDQKRIQKLDGDERSSAVSRAVSHGRSRKLLDDFDEGELIKNEEKMNAYSVPAQTNGDSQFVLVVGDMESDEYDDSPTFQWTNNPRAEHMVSITILERDTEIIYTIDKGSVDRFEKEFKEDIGEGSGSGQSEVVTHHHNDPSDDDCYRHSEVCTDVNWSCVADLLITYGDCAGAVIPIIQKPAAALCLADLSINVHQALNDIGCSTCADTDIQAYNICDDGWDIQPP